MEQKRKKERAQTVFQPDQVTKIEQAAKQGGFAEMKFSEKVKLLALQGAEKHIVAAETANAR